MNIKTLKKRLSKCLPVNLKDSLLKIVTEVNDPNYCEIRALELVQEARIYFNNSGGLLTDLDQHNNKVEQAICLLVMAMEIRNETIKKQTESRTRSKASGSNNSETS